MTKDRGVKRAVVIFIVAAFVWLGAQNAWGADVEISGSASATSISGDGSGLTNLTPGNIASGTANINISGNAATATTATTASSVTNGVLDCNGGRYEDNGDGTVSDCRTGLIWLKDANCTATAGGIAKTNGDLNWVDAGIWAANLADGICGLTDGSSSGDWRMPTKTEWMAMIASARKQGFSNPILTDATGTAQWTNGNVFTDVQSGGYWSSTTYALLTTAAWYVNMFDGYLGDAIKTSNGYVWPVRGGQ